MSWCAFAVAALAGLSSETACKRSCPPGQQSCGTFGKCVPTDTSTTNCGSCGHACPSTASCVAGKCIVTCGEGLGDCDGNADNGCETDLSSSAKSCGACGAACSGECKAGRCERFPFDGIVEQLVDGGDALYVETSASGSTAKKFFRAPWDGKQATLVVDATSIGPSVSDLDPFVVSGQDLYFVSDDTLFRGPAGGGGNAAPLARALVKPRYPAATKDWVIVTSGDWTRQSYGESTTVVAVPRAGGGARKELGKGWIGGIAATTATPTSPSSARASCASIPRAATARCSSRDGRRARASPAARCTSSRSTAPCPG
jgi:hypothetical protein